MDGLQKAIEKSLLDLPALCLAPLIRAKLLEQGIKITSRRALTLARQILRGKTAFSTPGNTDTSVQIAITDDETAGVLKKIDTFLKNDLPEILTKAQTDAAPPILSSLKKRWPAERRTQAREIADFRDRLHERWGRAISKLQMLVTMARDLGNNVNHDARVEPGLTGIKLVDVVTRLHARACQVAEEVVVLLETGFANGAMARWRTMHEISVTANFISKHSASCAERYTDHQIVESYKAAQEYEEIHAKLGYDPISANDLNEIRERYDRVIQKHGHSFTSPYGWAAIDLNAKKPTFKDIEKSVGIEHFRGHYRMASHGIHANPKGIFFSMTSMFPSELLLAGPSNAGLADAGHGGAVSLTSISATLVLLAPNFDHLVALQAMNLLSHEIGTAFLRAHEKLHRDESLLRGEESALDS